MKIHFWDSPSSHDERSTFRSKCQTEFGIKTSVDSKDLHDVNVLFTHGGDSHLLPKELGTILVVSFGDNPTVPKPVDNSAKRISYINATELANRFPVIIKRLRDANQLTISGLHDIIFSPDDPDEAEIERLLGEVCTKLPFADSWNTELRKKRHELIKIIEEKHGIQLT